MSNKNIRVVAELFFNAGDIQKQENFIIYPRSLENNDYDELLTAVCQPFSQEYAKNGIQSVHQIEQFLKIQHTYPDPTKFKLMSQWFIAQLDKGSIIFRYAYDGRLESGSHRPQYSIEGAFLKGVNLLKTKQIYEKKGIDIIDQIGSQLPHNIESLLKQEKLGLFERLEKKHQRQNNLEGLFNHFYVACDGEEIALEKVIETLPLSKINLITKIERTKKRIYKNICI